MQPTFRAQGGKYPKRQVREYLIWKFAPLACELWASGRSAPSEDVMSGDNMTPPIMFCASGYESDMTRCFLPSKQCAGRGVTLGGRIKNSRINGVEAEGAGSARHSSAFPAPRPLVTHPPPCVLLASRPCSHPPRRSIPLAYLYNAVPQYTFLWV